MEKLKFSIFCGLLGSSLFWLISFFAYKIGWELIAVEYLIFSVVAGLIISSYAYFIPNKQNQGL